MTHFRLRLIKIFASAQIPQVVPGQAPPIDIVEEPSHWFGGDS